MPATVMVPAVVRVGAKVRGPRVPVRKSDLRGLASILYAQIVVRELGDVGAGRTASGWRT